MILRDVVAESMEGVHVAPPVRQDFDREVEVHPVADQRFDLLAGGTPDVADALSTGADEDALLAFAFDVEDGSNVHGRLGFAVFLDLARHTVRHFVLELFERRLANELGGEESDGCVLISSSGYKNGLCGTIVPRCSSSWSTPEPV